MDEKKISVLELSKRTGLQLKTIYQYRSREFAEPRASSLYEIAKVLDVTMDELYGGEEQ
jgi:transcriptional regulator with XRE-family HTH domain